MLWVMAKSQLVVCQLQIFPHTWLIWNMLHDPSVSFSWTHWQSFWRLRSLCRWLCKYIKSSFARALHEKSQQFLCNFWFSPFQWAHVLCYVLYRTHTLHTRHHKNRIYLVSINKYIYYNKSSIQKDTVVNHNFIT